MNMIVDDLTELYDEWLKDGDILAEGADGGHGLIPTPITLRSIPLRSGFNCFEDNAGNLVYVPGEPGRADWIFPPKYQKLPWTTTWIISKAAHGKWEKVSAGVLAKYPPDDWSSDVGFDDSGWDDGGKELPPEHNQTPAWPHGSRHVIESSFVFGSQAWQGGHGLHRRVFEIDLQGGNYVIESVHLYVDCDDQAYYYFNGTEVCFQRSPIPNLAAPPPQGPIDITAYAQGGNNLLALQISNREDISVGYNPCSVEYEIKVVLRPTQVLGEQFYTYWAQIIGAPGDSPLKAFCIAGAHGINGYVENNGARFYTYDHLHNKVNNAWINAFVLGRFE